ncbi:secretin N-terminal domain-containing protein [Microbulbifer sp. PAAF003]|uniref:secretin N-terminal domain-containing protein n=1 Tax=Microbulbifer sp. PAAF003 TaxID=3243375 RepID=UPI004039B6FA
MIRKLILVGLLAGCASGPSEQKQYLEGITSPRERVQVGREQLQKDPGNVRLAMVVRDAELSAVQYYSALGDEALSQGHHETAIDIYQEGLAVDPHNKHLRERLTRAKSAPAYAREINAVRQSLEARNYAAAERSLEEAKRLFPNSEEVQYFESVIRDGAARQENRDLKIDLDFDKIDFPTAARFVADAFGVTVIVDSSVKDTPVSLQVEQVGFEEAFLTLLSMTKNTFKVIDQSTVLVFSDSSDRRKQYDDLQLRTYHLNNIPAKDMVSIIKGVLQLNKVTVNEAANSLLVRDLPEKLDIVDLLISQHDTSRGEVVLEVEILEINLNKAERLGMDYGSYSLGLPLEPTGVTGSILDGLSTNALLNVPSVAMRFFKQDVDATTLANPRVRVMDREKAKIHIGDRVPLRSAQIQDATGQTRTTYEYQEIGIRLQVEPRLHADDYVTITLALEVSSLGENLGTANEPAYRIGTRNAETVMHVRSGETAILGGLIREEERGTFSRVDGLSSIPGVSALFESSDDSDARTDVLLTITPKVVRSVPFQHAGRISIGTENRIRLGGSTELSRLKLRTPEQPPMMVNGGEESFEVVFDNEISANPEGIETGSEVTAGNAQPIESRDVPARISVRPEDVEYSLAVDEDLSIPIVASVEQGKADLNFNLVFNPAILDYVGFESPVDDTRVDFNGSNTLTVRTGEVTDPQALEVLFKGKRSGRSFVLVRSATVAEPGDLEAEIETGGTRVTVSE